jgi:hypothetical protein
LYWYDAHIPTHGLMHIDDVDDELSVSMTVTMTMTVEMTLTMEVTMTVAVSMVMTG